MTEFLLGQYAGIYFGAADADLAAMTELTNVKDVTLNHETESTDITTRANSGWKASAATTKSCTAEFEMQYKPGDAGFDAIQSAWLNSTPIELAILTEKKDQATAQGPKGNFVITNFSRKEALNEAIGVSVSAELSKMNEYIGVA